jgi:hypothetical protein
MISAFLTFAVAVSLAAPPANVFEPTEMGSAEITISVEQCLAGILRQDQKADQPAALAFCGCVTDAQRFNRKHGGGEASTAQLQRCHAQTKPPPGGGKAGT